MGTDVVSEGKRSPPSGSQGVKTLLKVVQKKGKRKKKKKKEKEKKNKEKIGR